MHTRLPGGKAIIVATAYYKPVTSSERHFNSEWLPTSTAQFPGTPILLGGDFNAQSTTCCYARTHPRGKALEDTADASNLLLTNNVEIPTCIGLHSAQQDTSPDLNWATPGLTRKWAPYFTAWVSDHLPILIHLCGKKLRERKTVKRLDWNKFRDTILDSTPPTSLNELCSLIISSSTHAQGEIQCAAETPHMDNHMANLWKRVRELATHTATTANGTRT